MFGTPDLTTAIVLAALCVALLLGLVSYHVRGRGYVNWGIGLLIVATSLALLARSFEVPGAATAVAMVLLAMGVMAALLTYHNVRWAHVTFAVGVALFLLGLPFLAAGRGDLALLALIAGPGLLMLVATLFPEIPAGYSRLGAIDASPRPTAEELEAERRRYTRLAAGLTVASLAGVWLFGGVPQGQVTEASVPMGFDEAMAARGAQLFQQYGCTACHTVTGEPGVGPTLRGVYGHRVRLSDGTQVLADEEYIRQSILNPDAQIVSGYSSGVMSTAIAPHLSEIRQTNNITALVEYIKSIAR